MHRPHKGSLVRRLGLATFFLPSYRLLTCAKKHYPISRVAVSRSNPFLLRLLNRTNKSLLFLTRPPSNDNAARACVYRDRLFAQNDVLVILASVGASSLVQPGGLVPTCVSLPPSSLTLFLSRTPNADMQAGNSQRRQCVRPTPSYAAELYRAYQFLDSLPTTIRSTPCCQ